MSKPKASKPRRKSLRKEALKVSVTGTDAILNFTLNKGTGELEVEEKSTEKNPDKIVFMRKEMFGNTLELSQYKNTSDVVIWFNGEFMPLGYYDRRYLLSAIMKTMYYNGDIKRRKRKQKRKSRGNKK